MSGTQLIEKKQFWILVIMLLIASIARLFPHPANVAPIAAMALFGGVFFKSRWMALVIPIACMFFSDVLLQIGHLLGYFEFAGFHVLMPVVYGAFLLLVIIGRLIQAKGMSMPKVIGGTIAGSVLFFLLTNFAVWISFMPYTWEALVQCYTQAIPFFRATLLGNLFYVAVLFGSYEFIKQNYLKTTLATQKI